MESDCTAADSGCVIACKKTSSYLRTAAKFAVENRLPLCLASAWSFKAQCEDLRIPSQACCLTCGLDLRNRRCFDLKIQDVDDTRIVEGVCCGCGQQYRCGSVEQSCCSESSIAADSSDVFDATFDESAICAVSTPLSKSKASPVLPAKVSSLKNEAKRNRKRRGSALERLLKEEDADTDRSLSGFLSMVSKH